VLSFEVICKEARLSPVEFRHSTVHGQRDQWLDRLHYNLYVYIVHIQYYICIYSFVYTEDLAAADHREGPRRREPLRLGPRGGRKTCYAVGLRSRMENHNWYRVLSPITIYIYIYICYVYTYIYIYILQLYPIYNMLLMTLLTYIVRSVLVPPSPSPKRLPRRASDRGRGRLRAGRMEGSPSKRRLATFRRDPDGRPGRRSLD